MTEDRLESLKSKIRKCRDERGWLAFHNPKDLAISISIEAAELLEEFQWKNTDEIAKKLKDAGEKTKIMDEMADVYIYLLELAEVLGVDLITAAEKKVKKNEEKYPVIKK